MPDSLVSVSATIERTYKHDSLCPECHVGFDRYEIFLHSSDDIEIIIDLYNRLAMIHDLVSKGRI